MKLNLEKYKERIIDKTIKENLGIFWYVYIDGSD